jgi:hypothetical protein
MLKISDGQCGMCAHFGEHEDAGPKFVQIRVAGEAPADLVASCGHPDLEPLKLRVAPTSGCAGYSPAKAS